MLRVQHLLGASAGSNSHSVWSPLLLAVYIQVRTPECRATSTTVFPGSPQPSLLELLAKVYIFQRFPLDVIVLLADGYKCTLRYSSAQCVKREYLRIWCVLAFLGLVRLHWVVELGLPWAIVLSDEETHKLAGALAQVIPLYGRGCSGSDSRRKCVVSTDVPCRPQGLRLPAQVTPTPAFSLRLL